LEITARCNLNCRHCYINLPAKDQEAKKNELTLEEIDKITDQAIEMGALWCLLTGGEPLLRKDFFEIYMMLKKKGLLVSVFTNAALLNEKHINLFKKYPPRNIEVSVYGVTQKTYEKVTRVPGSFHQFLRGIELIKQSGLKVRFKAMVMKSNLHELDQIARFCRKHTKDYYRFDPLLHLRYDGNPIRNKEILSERLAPKEIARIEQSDKERFQTLKDHCDDYIFSEDTNSTCDHLFLCGAGISSCVISPDGIYRLCFSLWHPDTIYDLRKGSLRDAFENFVPKVRSLRSHRKEYLEKCRSCRIVNLCLWCPAHAHLEKGDMDCFVDYFCEVALQRAKMLYPKRKT
jgi:radical SAM protein with 4Fe4S-binding SPASM domain